MTTATRPLPSSDAAYERNRRRQRAYGTWQPYVNAEPVRTHVRQLMAYGIGWMRVAELAGVPQGTVEKLLYGCPPRGMGPSKQVRPATADKLLAVHPEPGLLANVTDTDATGTHRRLQALVAAGWPQTRLAERIPMNRANFGKAMRNSRVRMSTERAVRGLYDQLWRTDPRDHGVADRWYNHARRHARDNHWAPVGAWDDDTIDDPAAFPDWTGLCGTPAGYTAHYSHRIPMCEPCRNAKTAQRHERRAAA